MNAGPKITNLDMNDRSESGGDGFSRGGAKSYNDDSHNRPLFSESESPLHEVESEDKFAIDNFESASLQEEAAKHPNWSQLNITERTKHILILILKMLIVLLLLYFFVCSLSLLSTGVVIIGGPNPQNLFKSETLENPVAGLMCGVLFTAIVQSSSTSTSAVVGLVAGKIITVRIAIPVIMGSNIGTSVTNTLLAMMQAGNRDRFRRAFAAATIHDMFNWLTTIILLPIETATGYLETVSGFIVAEIENIDHGDSRQSYNIKILTILTDPLTNFVIQINKTVLEGWSNSNETIKKEFLDESVVSKKGHIFADRGLNDKIIGAIILSISFASLFVCLLLLVHTLKSILKGRMAVWIRRVSVSNLPHCPSMTEYLLILMGAFLTFLVQSSSVFTSMLPPLVSIKALSIERAYCLTLGANIGTTTTAILAALAQTQNFSEGMQIALCHLLFNLTGALLFFPVPWTRFPIRMSKSLGNTTARYRWFAIVYVLLLFVILPLVFMGLSFAGTIYVISVACVIVLCFLFVVIVNSLREYKRFMPECLQSWRWLPVWCRGLEAYDRMFAKCACCNRIMKLEKNAGAEKDAGSNREEDGAEPEKSEASVFEGKRSDNLSVRERKEQGQEQAGVVAQKSTQQRTAK